MERISTSYLEYLTDDFSIWQHSKGNEIDFEKGYALDDGARALILVLNHGPRALASTYYNFLKQSLSENFINFYDRNREPLDLAWSEDAIGQSYWGMILWQKENRENLFDLSNLETLIHNFQSPRGIAYSLIGASCARSALADDLFWRLHQLFKANSTADWPWVEKSLTYGNAVMPLSFLEYYQYSRKLEALENAILMLNFLNDEMKIRDIPIAIGNRGWYPRESAKALFDQQPIDISYQVITNVRAYEITGNQKYLHQAILFFTWFWGNNLASKIMVDIKNQRCLDGLKKNSISHNSGAESIICFLWAQEKLWPHLRSLKTTIPAYQSKILENFFGDILIDHEF